MKRTYKTKYDGYLNKILKWLNDDRSFNYIIKKKLDFGNVPDLINFTKKRAYKDIKGMWRKKSSHMLIAGASGKGKTTYIMSLIKDYIEDENVKEVFYVDITNEIDIDNKKVKNIHTIEETLSALEEVKKTFEKRFNEYKDGKTEFKKIVFIIDRFDGTIVKTNNEDISNIILKELETFVQLYRTVNINLVVSVRKATTDNLPTNIRNNLQTNVLFQQMKYSHAEYVIPTNRLEELDVNVLRLNVGEAVIQETGGDVELIKVPFVSVEDL